MAVHPLALSRLAPLAQANSTRIRFRQASRRGAAALLCCACCCSVDTRSSDMRHALARLMPFPSTLLPPQVACEPPQNIQVVVEQYSLAGEGYMRLHLEQVGGTGDVVGLWLRSRAGAGGAPTDAAAAGLMPGYRQMALVPGTASWTVRWVGEEVGRERRACRKEGSCMLPQALAEHVPPTPHLHTAVACPPRPSTSSSTPPAPAPCWPCEPRRWMAVLPAALASLQKHPHPASVPCCPTLPHKSAVRSSPAPAPQAPSPLPFKSVRRPAPVPSLSLPRRRLHSLQQRRRCLLLSPHRRL